MHTRNTLDLNLAQLSKSWKKIQHNNFSDKDKQTHINQLDKLFDKLNDEDFSQLTSDEFNERVNVMKFFFKNLEFLENSNLNIIPYEIIECLTHALRDWIDTPDRYIIVTSLVNDLFSFSFDPSLVIESLYTATNDIYQLEFEHRLVQINIPKFLSRDFFASVVLYHELGHFIDEINVISGSIYFTIQEYLEAQKLTEDQIASIERFLDSPITDFLDDNYRDRLSSYIAEYFCDIFASQYVGLCLSDYLAYITANEDYFSETHPSPSMRAEVVKDFQDHILDKTFSPFLKIVVDITEEVTGRQLKIRYAEISSDDFNSLLPVDIENSAQLHYLFTLGWKFWLEQIEEIALNNKIEFHLSRNKIYDIINNLIEKSIGNYIVKNSWIK